MKILNVIENIDESYGGPAQSVSYLCKHMKLKGITSVVNSINLHDNEFNKILEDNKIEWNSYSYKYSKFFKFSPDLHKGLLKQVKNDSNIILHTNNQWNYPSYCAYKIAKKNNIPLVSSVHGSMSPWALKQYKFIKNAFWLLFQKRIFQFADCIHCTTTLEADFIRNNGIKSPIAIIPNGVELESYDVKVDKAVARGKIGLDINKKYIIFLGRIHKSKGIDILIKTWNNISKKYPDWNIIFGGPIEDEKYFKEIISFIGENKLNSVKYIGVLKGNECVEAYKASNLFVSPTWSENFGISIAEAMASGLPVITTKNAPWEVLEKEQCGWWIELHEELLQNSLEIALSSSQGVLDKMGNKCRNIIYENYSWSKQTEKMIAVYKWLLGEAEKPFFVYTD